MQLSTKVYILIKEDQELNALAYSDFISPLVAVRKRIRVIIE
jgi:hypothetical protein